MALGQRTTFGRWSHASEMHLKVGGGSVDFHNSGTQKHHSESAGKSTVAISQTSQVHGPRFQKYTCRGGTTRPPQDFTLWQELGQKTSLKSNRSPGTVRGDEEQPRRVIMWEERCPPRVEIKVAETVSEDTTEDRSWAMFCVFLWESCFQRRKVLLLRKG